MRDFILNSDEKAERQLLVVGESGCGKTAILAKAMSQVLSYVPDPENYTIILRFLGTTPSTSNIIRTYASILKQLISLFSLSVDLKSPANHQECRDFLFTVLMLIHKLYPQRRIIIYLDSVDQLSPDDYSLDWVLPYTADNTKIVFSCIPGHGDLLKVFLNKFPFEEKDNNLIKITNLDQELASLILNDFLKNVKRGLSKEQWDFLNDLLKKSTLYPLYITLVFDIVSKWTSFQEIDPNFMKCVNIDKCIEYLFRLLEKIHGKQLFSRSIIYMSSFKDGVSENEIEDILSLDDEVLYEVFEFHAPPIRRLPVALWSRIKFDLKNYMVEKEVHNTRVIYWYHRRFIEVANSFYVSKLNSEERVSVFSNVIDFYNETWKNKPKPYKYNEFVAKKKGLEKAEAEEKRDTMMQPTYLKDSNGNIVYNLRKITQLPVFISHLSTYIASPLACEYVYFNYHFLMGLFKHCDFTEIIDVLKSLTESSAYNLSEEAKEALGDLKMLSLIFLQCGLAAKDKPKSTAHQILSRSLNFYKISKYFTQLIDQFYEEALKENNLLLTCQQLDPPGGDLIFQLDKHNSPITHTCIGGDNDSFVLTLSSNRLHLINLSIVSDNGYITIDPPANEIKEFDFFLCLFETFDIEDRLSIKNIRGFFLVGSKKNFRALNYDGKCNFEKTFEKEKIQDVFIVSPTCFVVFYSNANYFEVYDAYKQQMVEKKTCKSIITVGTCSTHKEYINFKKDFDGNVIILVAYKSTELEVFQVELTSDEKHEYLNLKSLKSLGSLGAHVKNISFLKSDKYKFDVNEIFVSFTNGSIIFFDPSTMFSVKENELRLDIMNINISDSNKKRISFKFLERESERVLLLGSDKKLYIMGIAGNEEKFYLLEIKGEFEDGKIINDTMIMGFNKGYFHYYAFSLDEDVTVFKLLKIAELLAHYDKVVFHFIKSPMVLTASKDTSLKVFMFQNLVEIDKMRYDFDRCSKEIKKIVLVGDNFVASLTENSNSFDIWELIDSKISNNYKLEEAEIILDLFADTFNILLISSNSQNKKLTLRGLNFDPKSNKLKEQFQIKFDSNTIDYYQLLKINSNDFLFLTESLESQDIFLYTLRSKQIVNKSDLSFVHSSRIVIKLDEVLPKRNGPPVLEKAVLTNKSEILFLFYECILYAIDTKKGSVLSKENISDTKKNIDFFLSPVNITSNNLISLASIPKTDTIVSVDNLKNLCCFNFNQESNRIQKGHVTSGKNESINVESIRLNSSCLAAHEPNKNRIFVVSFESLFKKFQINDNNISFQVKLNNESKLDSFGLCRNETSENNEEKEEDYYLYLIENLKDLRFFNFKTGHELMHITLYSKIMTNVLCNKEFICMGMQDQRVISFMITNPERKENMNEKINKFEIKRPVNKHKKKAEHIFKAAQGVMDDSSDEREEIYEKIFDESGNLKENEITEPIRKMKKKVKKLSPFIFSCTKLNSIKNYGETNWIKSSLKSINDNNDFDFSQNNLQDEQEENDLKRVENIAFLKETNQKATLTNSKEIKAYNSGKNVRAINLNSASSQACVLQ